MTEWVLELFFSPSRFWCALLLSQRNKGHQKIIIFFAILSLLPILLRQGLPIILPMSGSLTLLARLPSFAAGSLERRALVVFFMESR